MNNNNGKTAATVAYITIIGTIIAYFLNDDDKKEFAYFHIRQALGLHLTFYLLSLFIGSINSWMVSSAFYLFFIILWIYGFIGAINMKTTPIPLLGAQFQKIFKSIIGNNNK